MTPPATGTQSNIDGLEFATHSSAPQHRLLIIEDDTATSIAIAKLAETIGYVTKAAASLEDADRLLRAERYDCVTLDLTLGRDSGVQLISTLAAKAPDASIIFVSGSPNWVRTIAASVARVARLNVIEAVSKPIDFSELRAVLAAAKESPAKPR
jgi:ActR/RegA family two-component response regulator